MSDSESRNFGVDGKKGTDFPFFDLNHEDLRQLYGLPFKFDGNFEDIGYESEDDLWRDEISPEDAPMPIKPGNYVAVAIQASLRKSVSRIPRRSKNLGGLLDFPLELILEVFEHLHPLDLYNMIRSTKGMRNILLSRKASLLWEKAFHRHPDILACPYDDVSLPQWASLLFGPATCDLCNHGHAMVDFTYRQRLCRDCLPRYWRHREQDMGGFLPDHLGEVVTLWSLVRYTHRSRPMLFPQPYEYMKPPRYWRPDILIREKEMLRHLSAIAVNSPNAKEAYASYKEETRASTIRYLARVLDCNDWALSIWRKLEGAYISKFSALCAMSRTCLIKFGHSPVDVDAVRSEIVVHLFRYFVSANHIKFSKKVLRKHLSKFEELARKAKDSRVLSIRREKISKFYENVCQLKFDSMLWDSLPLTYDIMILDPIAAYVESATDNVGVFSEEEVEAAITNFVPSWRLEKKQMLARLVTSSDPSLECHGNNANVDEGVLELATAVFCHSLPTHTMSTDTMIGWDEAKTHLSCRAKVQEWENISSAELTFSELGHATVVLLLRLLGLDPNTTLANELSALNRRFMCTSCCLEHQGHSVTGSYGTYAWTWKECVAHVVSKHYSEGPPCIALLTEEMTKPVLYHEQKQKSSYPSQSDAVWACRHCAVHFKIPVSWSLAKQHVRIYHAIREPMEGVDFFYRQKKMLRDREPFFLETVKPWSYYCCLICSLERRDRLLRYVGVAAHFEKMHRMIDPTEGVHWKRMKLISQTTDELLNETKAIDVNRTPLGRSTILLLLNLLGLDPDTALERDVTALNKIFLCLKCPLTQRSGAFRTVAMNWKECIFHTIRKKTDHRHNSQRFVLLTDEIAESVLLQELSYPHYGDSLWSCKHCLDHFNTSVSKGLAVLHVQEAHAIEEPIDGVDFFYQRSRRHNLQKPYFLGRGDDLNCWCLICQPIRQRLWLRKTLMAHLIDTHDIRHPVKDVHWKPLRLTNITT
ncbi:hypothetical protein GALMADRAFT_246804 [Galerina marginata CBS 339.88]|uniref:F-box domain-containing protein n=1 Tax=Galerina marginata (strain CBS 339.88) TaxID=685588 RepID=A0A067TBW4_GALM3|nr:hypothetical protein GALMADRAFT_246804 [Galerina marginata CBS 339.88]